MRKMPALSARERHFKIESKFSAIYTQLAENKQKIPCTKFFQLSNSLTFAFPNFGVVLYCLFSAKYYAGAIQNRIIFNKPK